MNRIAKIYFHKTMAGILREVDKGYEFAYDENYMSTDDKWPISNTLPLQSKPYISNVLFPFFDGLIPEGWLIDIAEKNWKISTRDRFGLLLLCCEDCIGAVSVVEEKRR